MFTARAMQTSYALAGIATTITLKPMQAVSPWLIATTIRPADADLMRHKQKLIASIPFSP